MRSVYRDLDQETLDRQYDASSLVDPAYLADFRKKWQAQSEQARASISCELDIAYGPTAGQKLDIFRPAGAGPAPVQIYIHGGYWASNDKNVCSYTALGLTRLGFLTVVVNYDLVPKVRIGDQVDQLRAALVWVWENIARHGGDRDRIGIIGHSAGGQLAMMLAATDFSQRAPDLPSDAVKSFVCLSGVYEMEPIRLSKTNEILNLTPDEVPPLSPIRLKPWLRPACVLLVAGGQEGDEYPRQAADMAAAWSAHLPDIRAEVLPAYNHFSIRAALAESDSETCKRVMRTYAKSSEPADAISKIEENENADQR